MDRAILIAARLAPRAMSRGHHATNAGLPSSSTTPLLVVLALGCAGVVGAVTSLKCPESAQVRFDKFCLRVPRLSGLSDYWPHWHAGEGRTCDALAPSRKPEGAHIEPSSVHYAQPAETSARVREISFAVHSQRPWLTGSAPPSLKPRFSPNRVSPFWPRPNAREEASVSTLSSAPSIVPAAHSAVSIKHDDPRRRERLELLLQRLAELGAQGSSLEWQGGNAAGFRFRCEVPLPNSPRYRRFFQAYDIEPEAAVERVLMEVEAWKAASRR